MSDEPAITEEGGGIPSRVNFGAIPRGVLTIIALFGFLGCGKPDIRESREGETAVAQTPPSALPGQPQSLVLVGDDGSWSGSISPAGIVFRRGARDSLVFEYKPPTVNGAISDYESLTTGKDTVRISISLAMTKCTDKAGKEYTHMAQVWLTGKQGGRELNTQTNGCANKR